MVIITKTTIEKYASQHCIAAEPLNSWHSIAKKANWDNLTDMRNTFNSVDMMGNGRYCFNIIR
ncbi:type II toxin-antitoxin system HigB family toxin [Arachidicoccus soli]|uniref:Type II toxin-antitoxin system HigB family toxin n=1 Tax=Arachidicoccus soli TaxID=2341117 RepID=A0A386HK65_9BACT|nr:type II toxin-antitoxin system HigB family toxin [Arachidicoccus soli]AYD46267.1 type II toxin-antitoxin system HigB family toxin [Arachidicoccus soli]